MTTEQASEYEAAADEERKQCNFAAAGEGYTCAAYEYWGEPKLFPPSTWGSTGMLSMAIAAVCNGLDGDDYCCVNRCQQGVLVAADLLDRALSDEPPSNFDDRAQRGAWYEYMGDFALIAREVADEGVTVRYSDDERPGDLYVRAREVYREAGDPGLTAVEADNDRALTFFTFVARGAEFDLLEFETMREYETEATLSEWVQYKEETLPELIADVLESGEWQHMWDD